MSEFVRVKDNGTGHEFTVTRERFDTIPEGAVTELSNKPAGDLSDPIKYRESKEQAKARRAGTTATTSKEND